MQDCEIDYRNEHADDRECQRCKNPFTPRLTGQRYCDDCAHARVAVLEQRVSVIVNHWVGVEAGLTAGVQPGLHEFTADEIVALHGRFDVMLTTPRPGKVRTEHDDAPMLWLDERGRRFRQR